MLDIGCGDGLLLFLLGLRGEARAGERVGIDIDERKIGNARQGAAASARFETTDVSSMPSASFDCVSIVDVLYLLPLPRWKDFLSHGVRVLRPGGLLIVKEVADTPRWKHWIGHVEELLAIKVLRMTRGDSPHLEPVDVYRAALEEAGTEVVRVERIDAGRPHAHVLLLARKP